MSVFWSYAATGLSISIIGLAVGQQMVSPVNRPNFLRSKAGEAAFGLVGLLLTLLLFFFGFRLFWDNSLWGLLQFVVAALVTGAVSKLNFLRNGLTPFVCCALAIAQAIKIW
jgi:hypothetical protein